MEMTNAYSVIANGGFQVAPWFIERVTRDDDNEVIDEATPQVACPSCADGQETVEIDGKEYPVAPMSGRRGSSIYSARHAARRHYLRYRPRCAEPKP